jgi:hypothetical protein
MEAMSMGKLRLFWWGRTWRGWKQFGSGATVCADKDYSVTTAWTFLLGPLEIQWWNRSDWRDFCYTPEESAEVDRQFAAEMRKGSGNSGDEKHG